MEQKQTRVLFVCLGNICRSPAAHGIFSTLCERAGVADRFKIDSAGTSRHHVGDLPDSRMIVFAKLRGYFLNHRARQFDAAKDFNEFDMILTMDDQNYKHIHTLDVTKKYGNKIRKMTDFCKVHNVSHVPDPYYKGDEGFALVLDILEDACRHLLESFT